MSQVRQALVALLLATAGIPLLAQGQPARVEFDVVSIKRHVDANPNIRVRTEPGGLTTMTNVPMSMVLSRIVPASLRDMIGLPEWVTTERWDIAARAPAGSSVNQLRPMWQAVFTDRMKFAAHTEERERDVFALVLARKDGKLGPQLKPSTLDCDTAPTVSSLRDKKTPLTAQDYQERCGMGRLGPTTFVSGGVPIQLIAGMLPPYAGGAVENRTGLTGIYAFTLTFSQQHPTGPSVDAPAPGELPDVFVAVQEQLGLKLLHDKKLVPVFVVDHIERPSEN
jgi:uncharacterized protein (TIGR03435 family)